MKTGTAVHVLYCYIVVTIVLLKIVSAVLLLLLLLFDCQLCDVMLFVWYCVWIFKFICKLYILHRAIW